MYCTGSSKHLLDHKESYKNETKVYVKKDVYIFTRHTRFFNFRSDAEAHYQGDLAQCYNFCCPSHEKAIAAMGPVLKRFVGTK